MRRHVMVVGIAIALLVLGSIGLRDRAGAQDATLAEHPIVGTWIVTAPDEGPSVVGFGADGIMSDVEADEGAGVGAWQADGETTASFTLVINYSSPEFTAAVIVRDTVEVAADGQSATLAYSVTVTTPDGAVVFADQAEATATRLPIEPMDAMGTPLAGYPTWTTEEEDAGGEEATPAA